MAQGSCQQMAWKFLTAALALVGFVSTGGLRNTCEGHRPGFWATRPEKLPGEEENT